MKKDFGMILFWFLLLLVVIAYCRVVYAEITKPDHVWYDMRGKGLKEWKLEDHIKKEQKPETKPEPKKKELPKETKQSAKNAQSFDLDKYARAVAKHETASCTKGYGKMYNNCFGMKNGRIAPCKKIGKNRMCIYETREESYEAFKKVWKEGYGNKFPTIGAVRVYSGNDRANIWLANVTKFYNEQF